MCYSSIIILTVSRSKMWFQSIGRGLAARVRSFDTGVIPIAAGVTAFAVEGVAFGPGMVVGTGSGADSDAGARTGSGAHAGSGTRSSTDSRSGSDTNKNSEAARFSSANVWKKEQADVCRSHSSHSRRARPVRSASVLHTSGPPVKNCGVSTQGSLMKVWRGGRAQSLRCGMA